MRRHPCSYLLLASLILVFAVELAVGAIGDDARLLDLGAIQDAGIRGGQVWRVLTYAWLHASTAHLTANALLLWWVGRIVERRTGSLAMLGVYLAGALTGGIIIALKASLYPKPGVSVGASAAIFGLLTCALVLFHRRDTARFGQPMWVRLTLWAILVSGLVASFLPGVSLAGHAAGSVTGGLMGFSMPTSKPDPGGNPDS